MNAASRTSRRDLLHSLRVARAHQYLQRMIRRIFVTVATLLIAASLTPFAQAQSESDAGAAHFHRAAQHYLAGDINAAREAVDKGLAVAPEHPKLNALRAQIDALPPTPRPSDDGAQGAGGQTGEDADQDASSGDEGTDGSNPGAPDPGTDSSDSPDSEAQSGGTESGAAEPGAEPGTSESGAESRREPVPGTASEPPGGTGAPSPSATAPEADMSLPEVQNPSASPAPRPASSQQIPTLTRVQAEQLLQLVAAQEQPLMQAMKSFGRASQTGPDW